MLCKVAKFENLQVPVPRGQQRKTQRRDFFHIYLKLNKKAMAMTCAHLANAYGKGINDQDNLQKSEESNSNDKEMDQGCTKLFAHHKTPH